MFKNNTYKCNTVQHIAMGYNWSCTACGMSSGRKFSVKRHVDNVHLGDGGIIPFVEYVSGRRGGYYPSQSRHQIGEKRKLSVTRKQGSMHFENLIHKVMVEIENDMARKIANAVNKPADDPIYSTVATYFRTKIFQENYVDLIKDFQKGL